MQSETIKPGTYLLQHELANPSPDRRANQSRLASWHSWVTWPPGMVFIVEPNPSSPQYSLRVYARGGFAMDGFRSDSPIFEYIIAALEPMQEAPSDFLRRSASSGLVQHYALGILDRLNIPLDSIKEIMDEMDNEEEES